MDGMSLKLYLLPVVFALLCCENFSHEPFPGCSENDKVVFPLDFNSVIKICHHMLNYWTLFCVMLVENLWLKQLYTLTELADVSIQMLSNFNIILQKKAKMNVFFHPLLLRVFKDGRRRECDVKV